ncbi:hypothetical protein SAMN05444156_0918 [Verrucomicrobium sp. GAS474]|uniref:PulJ/GspJ family protein n=1 Tax=Verrucomicrobium sp. GAS474 TaxID=1882831 RepID=UPI00087D4813|nr:type II secretion system protein [Verrucomicrobium sp. GAS474]SDT94004.1 hypothetical protein SAMN05444156_0918 [Verrucomicrobium sp. GAS474]
MPFCHSHPKGGAGIGRTAFTLVEVLVAMVVLILMVVFLSQLFRNASDVAGRGERNLHADAEAREVFDRMALDFSRILRRGDIDYYLKNDALPQPGNDQAAFYSEASGYAASPAWQSTVSVIAYRIGPGRSLQRMGKGLLWNGASAGEPPMVFLPATLAATWPAAVSATTSDAAYEVIGPDVFRMEYDYVLKKGAPSALPWDASLGHKTVNGLADVVAIGVTLAIADPRGRALLNDDQLNALVLRMPDFSASMKPGDLEVLWRKAVSAAPIPHAAAEGIRVYRRFFQVTPAGEIQ